MAIFYDISTWQEREWYNTGGTRNKAVFENPTDNSLYYFKTSLKKQDKDYRYEFWSEIIASEIGTYFGFNVLKYEIASHGTEVGCMSKLMIKENESLIEGYRYLVGFDSTYSYNDKQRYTFQFILKALRGNKLDHYIGEIIKIIIFDSIIGNSDRHQENWGFIERNKSLNNTTRKMFISFKKEPATQVEYRFFTPIYDSGSCLGREIVDSKIVKMLSDEKMIDSYIDRGKSEIHWQEKKLNHFKLIEKIKIEYDSLVQEEIMRVRQNFDSDKIVEIVMNVDKEIPISLSHERIPRERKELIIKLITLRCERLISLLR